MHLAIDFRPIEETQDELPRFVAWLEQVIQAMRRVWQKENRRSGPVKIIEHRF